MARTTDMAAILRRAGLKVIEVPGWETRGHGALESVSAIICHHTATNASAPGNYPTLTIVRDGRSDLPGPLAQLGLGRDGTWYVIAAGVSYHAGATQYTWQDNWHAIGVEAEAEGTGDSRDWPKVQMDSYARGAAALAKAFGIPNSRVLGHKEIASAAPGGLPNGRKIDPSFNMDTFRVAVARGLEQEEPDMDTTQAKQLSETRAIAGHVEDLIEQLKDLLGGRVDDIGTEAGLTHGSAHERELILLRRIEGQQIAAAAAPDAVVDIDAGAVADALVERLPGPVAKALAANLTARLAN